MIPGAEPHIRAVDARLKAGLPASVGVGLGRAPAGVSPPFIVQYPDPGDVQAARLNGERAHLEMHIMVHAVGVGPEQATWAGDRAREVLLGAPPAVPGRRVHRLTQTMAPPPIVRDDDVNPVLYVQVTEYRLTSDPA